MPFSIVRGENRIMLPSENELLAGGDEVLFCGTEHGERMLSASMNNAYTLDYLITGRDKPRGYLFRWFENRFNRVSME
jgi:hypothetical protein